MRRSTLLLVAFIAVVASQAEAPNAAGPQAIAAAVSGLVIVSATGQPASGAEVTMLLDGANPNGTMATKTGPDGRFAIPSSRVRQDGRYALSATLAGYGSGAFGARPGESNLVVIRKSKPTTDLIIRIYKYGSLSGRVIDDHDRPVPDAVVDGFVRTFVYGENHFLGRTTSRTDQNGTFRITPVWPGDYVIGAWLGIPPGSASAVANAVYRQPATAFFPDAISYADATIVHVGLEDDHPRVDIRLRPPTASRVIGSIAGPVPPMPDNVFLRSEDLTMLPLPRSSPVAPDGRFEFNDVTPGRYVVLLRPDYQSSGALLWARQPLVVDGMGDVRTNVEASQGVTVSGEVRLTDATDGAQKIAANVRVRIMPTRVGHSELAAGSVGLDSGWKFSFGGVAPGRYVLAATGLPPEWGMSFDSDGLGGLAVDVSDRAVFGVLLAITAHPPQPSRLTGVLRDSTGMPTDDGTVVVYPADPTRRTVTSAQGSARTTRPDNEGTFQLTGLPPGEYLVAVLPSLDYARVSDPIFLATLVPAARVILARGDQRALDIRLPR